MWWLGNRLAKDGQKSQAVEMYKRLIEKFPNHPRGDDALYEAAELYRAQNDVKECAPICRMLAERCPGSSFVPKAWYRLGGMQERAGDKAQARESFKRAAAHDAAISMRIAHCSA